MIWLMQTGTPPSSASVSVFDEIVRALHTTRLRHARPGVTIDIADTRAIVHLTTIAAFGDALIGARLRRDRGDAHLHRLRRHLG